MNATQIHSQQHDTQHTHTAETRCLQTWHALPGFASFVPAGRAWDGAFGCWPTGVVLCTPGQLWEGAWVELHSAVHDLDTVYDTNVGNWAASGASAAAFEASDDDL